MEARPKVPLYQALARALGAWSRCEDPARADWRARHLARARAMVDSLPHGSGIDGKTWLDHGSREDRIVIHTEYHAMNGDGFYTRWHDVNIKITPSLSFGAEVRVTGGGDAKDYLQEVFQHALFELVDEFSFNDAAKEART